MDGDRAGSEFAQRVGRHVVWLDVDGDVLETIEHTPHLRPDRTEMLQDGLGCRVVTIGLDRHQPSG